MISAKEIINKYGNISHMNAFIIGKENGLNDQEAMWLADEVYNLLNPTPITNMNNWREETWNREDFKELKKLILKHVEAEAFTCYSNHQLILVHLRIDENKSYKEVLDLIKSFKNFEYKLWGKKATACEISHYTAKKQFKNIIENINEELDKFFVYSNGNSEYLISTSKFKDIQEVNFEAKAS